MIELKKVLIVDDEKDLASAISAYLTLKGYSTTVCLESKEAFQKARNAQYDIIITDFRMPKLSGADLINSFRSSNFNDATPIILSSGFQDEAIAELKGVNLTNVRMLPKPFKMENLLNVIKENENKNSLNTSKPTAQKVDAGFVNIIITSIIEVLTEGTSLKDIKPSSPKLLSKEVTINTDISGITILLSKEFQGSFSLSFKSNTYLQIINQLVKVKFDAINDDNSNYLSEIINMACKKINNELTKKKSELKKTNPVVFCNQNHPLPDSGNPRTLLISFDSSAGPFWTTIVLNQSHL